MDSILVPHLNYIQLEKKTDFINLRKIRIKRTIME